MSIFATKLDQLTLHTKIKDVILQTFDTYNVLINGNTFASNGDVSLNNINLRNENENENNAIKLHNDDGDLWWGDRPVIVEGDNAILNNIEIGGNLKIGGQLYTFPPNNGFHSQVLTSNGDGHLFWRDSGTNGNNLSNLYDTAIDDVSINDIIKISNINGELLWTNTKSLEQIDINDCIIGSETPSYATFTYVTINDDLIVSNDINLSGDIVVGGNMQIFNAITDENDNVILNFDPVEDAVNYITIENGISNPTIRSNGSHNNIGLDFRVKGTGIYNFYGSSSSPAKLQIFENSSHGDSSITICAPEDITTSYTLKLPPSTGSINQVLKSDGSGGMIWGDGIDSLISNYGSGRLIVSDGSPFGVAGASNLLFDGSLLSLTGNLKLTGNIIDSNNNSIIHLTQTDAAVNYINIKNNSANNNPLINVLGDDINIGIDFQTKGSGSYNFKADTISANIKLFDTTNHYLSLTVPTLNNNINLVLPSIVGNNNQVLTSDGNGNLSWTNKIEVANDETGKMIYSNGSGVLSGSDLKQTGSNMTFYKAINDANPTLILGSSSTEKLSIQTLYNTGTQSLLKTVFNTSTASSDANRGKYEFNVDDANVLTIDDDGLIIKASGTLEIGTSVILSDVSGSTTLLNIDAMDNITKTTIQTAITSLVNLVSIGTITNGTWNGTAISPLYGGTGQTTLGSNCVLTGNGINGIGSSSNLTFNGSILNLNGHMNISGDLRDSNGNEVIKLGSTSSAVNEITITNNTTTNNPIISASGNDSSIGIDFQSKGYGLYKLKGNTNTSAELALFENSTNGSNYISFKAPASINNNIILTLPNTTGSVGQVLTTDGSGALSWTTKPTLSNDGSYRLVTTSGNGNLAGESNLTFTGVNLSQYVNVNNANPEFNIGATSNERVQIQSIYNTDTKILDRLLICTKTDSTDANKGKIDFNVDDIWIATFNDNGLLLSESGTLTIGSSTILSDANGTTTLLNIDALDNNTKTTVQTAITSLLNLTSIGTITAGTWNGNAISVPYGGTGQTSLLSNSILTGNGTNGIVAESTFTYDGTNLKQYVNIENADPTISVGSGANERFIIQTPYNGQQLDRVKFISKTDSSTGDKGKYEFYVDDVLVTTFDDDGIVIKTNGTLEIGTSTILMDLNDTITLLNIDNLDNITKNTIQTAITSLSNLTSIGTITSGTWNGSVIGVPYGGTGQSSLTSDCILTGNGANGIVAESNLTFNGSILTLQGQLKLSGSIFDTNMKEYLKFSSVNDAVNEITLSNNSSGNNPILLASGDDSDIGLDFQTKGFGKYRFGATASGATEILLFEQTTNGSNYLALKAPTSIASNFNLIFPDNVGTSGYYLTSDGTGNMVWSNNIFVNNQGDNRILTSNGSNGIDAESNLIFNGSNLLLTGNFYVSGSVIDVNANELIKFISTSGAVNEITIKNNSSGNNPGFAATGNDSNIGLDFQSKGSGKYVFKSTASNSSSFILSENTNNGSHTLTLKAPESLISNMTFVLPDNVGTVNQVLATDGNGNTSWIDGSNLTINNDGNNRIITATGSSGLNGEANLTFDGTALSHYITANDGNPIYSIGSSSTESFNIQSIYDSGQQTLNKVMFTTKATSISPDKGKFEFYVDDSLITSLVDSGMTIKASGTLAFGAIPIITDDSGTTTLSNIDAIDATTEATLEAAIDTLTNLTSVGTITTGTWNATSITVPYGGTGATSFTSGGLLVGNGTSALSASSNLTYSSSILNLATSSKIAIGSVSIIDDSEGTTTLKNIDAIDATTEATLEAAIDTLSNLTSVGTISSGTWNGSMISPTYGGTGVASLSSITALSGLSTIGTLTTGTWNASVIEIPYGGTGATSFTSGGLLIGNGTSALSASSALTYSSSILNLAASSKIAIGSVPIIDDSGGTTTLSNIDAIDATTEATLEAAIDTLTNLTSIGTITTGTWNGTLISPTYGGTGASSFTSGGLLIGNNTSSISASSDLTYSSSILNLVESSKIAIGSVNIIDDSSGTTTLKNIDAIDATTEATLEAAIDTLTNLTTIGTITTGTWNGSVISPTYGGTGVSSLSSITALSGLNTIGTITSGTWNGSLISPVYGGTGATSFTSGGLLVGNGTSALSASSELTYSSSILNLATSSKIAIGSVPIIDDSNGTTTLKNIDAIDAITEATLEAAIDTLTNLTSIGTITTGTWNGTLISPTYGGTGVSSLSSITSLSGLSTIGTITTGTWNGTLISPTYGGTGVSSLSSITSLSGLSTIGTITNGTWNGTLISPVYGGTGASSFTSGGLLIGNDTSAVSASSDLTYSSSILNLAVSSKIAIGSVNIIDDSSGTTTLKNIDAIDSVTETTLSTTSLSSIRLKDSDTNYFQIKANNAMDANVVCTLPDGVGGVGQSLVVSNVAGTNQTLGYGTPAVAYTTISSNTTLTGNMVYLCDTSSATFTVSMPTAPSTGTALTLIDSTGSFATNNLLIDCVNSNHRLYISRNATANSTLTLTQTNMIVSIVYTASNRWMVSYDNSSGIKIALIRDEKVKNTVGGQGSHLTWLQRDLNTISDPDGLVNVTSNNFTILQPGKYFIEARVPGADVGSFKALLTDLNDNVICVGTSEYNYGTAYYAQTHSYISILQNLTTSQSYKITFKANSNGGNVRMHGFQTNMNDFYDNPLNEVYTLVKIIKYDDPVQNGIVSLPNLYSRESISSDTAVLDVNTIYSVDTASNTVTVGLPDSATVGDYIELLDSTGNFGTNNLSITTDDNYMFVNSSIAGISTVVVTNTNVKVKCTYVALNRWCIEYPNNNSIKIALLREEQAKNTVGGTPVAASWNNRTINTEFDPEGIVTLSSNMFTLRPGKYMIDARCPVYNTNKNRIALYLADDTLVSLGSSEYSNASSMASSAFVSVLLNISTATTYQIKHYTTTATGSTQCLGVPANINDALGNPAVEVYTEIKIVKYDVDTTTGIFSLMNYYNRNTISTTTNPLVVNTIYSCDTSGGAFTVTLPSIAPAQGDYIELIDSTGSFQTNNLTIAAAGNYMFVNSNSTGTSSLVIGITNCKIKCTYVASNRWCLEYQNATGIKVAILKEEQAKNTGGGTNVAATWTTRTINTEYDPDNIVTLSLNQFTLLPGKYHIQCHSPFFKTAVSRIALYTSDNVLVSAGSSESTANNNNVQLNSYISYQTTISSATTYVLKYYTVTAVTTTGLGIQSNINDANATALIEVYTTINIMKYDDPISSGIVSISPSAYVNKLAITGSITLAVNTYYYITSSGTYTLTLPASPSLGDIIEITDGTGALTSNVATITRAGSQNILIGDISVTSFDMNRNGMKCKLEYVNTNRWSMTTSTNEGIWQTYTLNIGAVTTAPTKANVVKDVAQYSVIGKTLNIRYDYRQSAAGTAGNGRYLFPLPTGYTTNLTSGTHSESYIVGYGVVIRTGAKSTVSVEVYDGTNLSLRQLNAGDYVHDNNYSLNSDQLYSFYATIPLT